MVETEAILKARAYLSIIKGFIQVESAYLFGSYATGSARSDSDIDIGIFTNAPVDDYFAVVKKLFTARRGVDTLIEPHLFITDNDASGFHEEVKKGIKLTS
jgi:predicted nucleotidyltransferase